MAILFTLLLSAESLWLFALSTHIARFMEKAAPIYWIASLGGLEQPISTIALLHACALHYGCLWWQWR